MIRNTLTKLGGTTVVVRIPMCFQRRGGRKRIVVAPDGSEFAPTSKPRPDGTLVKALAWRWQRMLDEGVYASVSEIGGAENLHAQRMDGPSKSASTPIGYGAATRSLSAERCGSSRTCEFRSIQARLETLKSKMQTAGRAEGKI